MRRPHVETSPSNHCLNRFSGLWLKSAVIFTQESCDGGGDAVLFKLPCSQRPLSAETGVQIAPLGHKLPANAGGPHARVGRKYTETQYENHTHSLCLHSPGRHSVRD